MSKLFSTTRIPSFGSHSTTPTLKRFAQGEEGSMTILGIGLLMALVLIGGISYDLQRNEMERVRIQQTADRAVLAAADLDQTTDPETIVRDYFEKSNLPMRANAVTVEEGLNFRTVSVNADAITPTNFMNLIGIDSLPLRSAAAAEERVNNVEISLVLDISGSMGEGDKMANLRDAADTFVDAVINESTEDLVSISMVPYSEHVSAGEALLGNFPVDRNNPFSHCMEFTESDFDTTTLRRDKQYDQVQHIQWSNSGFNDVSNPVCPIGAHEDIVTFSQNTVALKNQISQLRPRGSTSIFAGMKWATGLLDPDYNVINRKMVTSGDADPAFAARPASFEDRETLKTVILMTDGQNHFSYRVTDQVYANQNHANHWAQFNVFWWLNRNVRQDRHFQWRFLKYTPDYGDTLLSSVCDAAKEKNIVIWSIGFEVEDHGAGVMRNCASSPSHFFRVEGVEIKEAFRAIARQINQLRLTQ